MTSVKFPVTPKQKRFSRFVHLAHGLLSAVLLTACMHPAPKTESAVAETQFPGRGPDVSGDEMLFENFEGAPICGGWWSAFDTNGLGTEFHPDPFELHTEGCPASPGFSAHMWGVLGADAAPWSWAQIGLETTRATRDLTKWNTVRFWAKGEPGEYVMIIAREVVTDSNHFNMKFQVTDEWTEIALPLDKFTQFGWGKAVPREFTDIVNLQFTSKRHGSPFDLYIDHITFSTEKLDTRDIPYPTDNWFAYDGIDVEKRKGTALDVSGLLDAPAGKHGWIVPKGEDFVFQDGTPARFWGVNIVASANFPSKEDAIKTADLLAQMGVNMTRHHHYDAPWTNQNIFGKTGTTRQLDKDAMDRFDFFIAELQKRGIYQYMDLLVHRAPYAADGIPDVNGLVNGYKMEGEFVPELIALQEEFVNNFLNHKNPYTKKTYGKDPAFCMMEIINEDSLFYMSKGGDFGVESQRYKDYLNQKFSEWLAKKYPDDDALRKAWKSSRPGPRELPPLESLEKKNINAIVPFAEGGERDVSEGRGKDTYAFYYDTMMEYFNRIIKVVRDSGSKAPVTGSNHWVSNPIDLYANAQLDYVDRHDYWSHPHGGWNLEMITHDNSPMVQHPAYGLVGGVGNRRVYGKPYIVTEWQSAIPNDYRQDCNLAMAAYSAFQNWSGVQFAYSHDNTSLDPKEVKPLFELFDILDQPTFIASWPAAALLYHRQDVTRAKAETGVWHVISRDAVFDPTTRNGLKGQLALAEKTGIRFDDTAENPDLEAALQARTKGDTILSSTGELSHNAVLGRFTVNTPRSQGAASLRSDDVITLQNVEMKLSNPFAVVTVTALELKPIAESKGILITALGNVVNSGMERDFAGDRLSAVGSLPVLVEPIEGAITLKEMSGDLSGAVLYALDPSGQRKKEVPFTVSGTSLTFEMSSDHQTMYYELVRK
ncbi:MAG: CIA30 family protein [Deltaproteobacteria bacterium]|nr:CIA30 family protein [Deltaproteobacteria bacterium]MBN2674602.1 CIA30 family protein [Deltaproteobacteria bacterium]